MSTCRHNRLRPTQFYRLEISSLVAGPAVLPAFPAHILRQIMSYLPPDQRLLGFINLLRLCGQAGKTDQRDLLTELNGSDRTLFYRWISQRVHHTLTAGSVKGNPRSPTWTPILVFFPKSQRVLAPGVYFSFDPNVDVTQGTEDLNYVFQPVLDYLTCHLTGCPGMALSYHHFIESWSPGRHRRHRPGCRWILTNSASCSLPLIPDSVCGTTCQWCLVHGLH